MTDASLCLIKDSKTNRYAMVYNHRGINAGFVNFPGGKREKNESILDCARREAYEETGLKITNLKKIGYIEFHPIEIYMHIFMTDSFTGKLRSSNPQEVDVFWQDAAHIPFDKMRPSDKRFLSDIFAGKYVCLSYTFDQNFNLLDVRQLEDNTLQGA